ncbi:MAG: FHA domain-containing protein [Nannocystaceae bacterium]
MGDSIHVLQFLSGKYKGKAFPLGPDGDNFVVGRSGDADLVLADANVSRKHARIFAERDRLWITDLGSRNGTLINGVPQGRHCLHGGDRIVLGGSLIAVELRESSELPDASTRAGEAKRTKQGVDNGTSKSMSGSLEDIPLVDVLQFLATSRKSGTINVRNDDDNISGSVYLQEGNAYYARIGDAKMDPEKAMMRMILWPKGRFALDNAPFKEEPHKRITTPLGHILMESARIQDEISHLADRHNIPEYRGTVAVVSPSPVRWHTLEAADLEIIQSLVEGDSWADVLDRFPHDDLTLTQQIVKLAKRGLVHYD